MPEDMIGAILMAFLMLACLLAGILFGLLQKGPNPLLKEEVKELRNRLAKALELDRRRAVMLKKLRAVLLEIECEDDAI
jgi:hypothetical protein